MLPSYPLVADVRMANISLTYRPRIPGTFHQETRGNSRPPISKVVLLAVQIAMMFIMRMTKL
jgi:hypothetical protein